jgi:hypothetical protein
VGMRPARGRGLAVRGAVFGSWVALVNATMGKTFNACTGNTLPLTSSNLRWFYLHRNVEHNVLHAHVLL